MANANSHVEEVSGSENPAYFEAAQAELCQYRRELAKHVAALYAEFPNVRWVGSLDFEGLPIIGVLARNSCCRNAVATRWSRLITVSPNRPPQRCRKPITLWRSVFRGVSLTETARRLTGEQAPSHNEKGQPAGWPFCFRA